MKHLHDTTWEEVFAGWKQREGNDAGWIHCAVNLKGWPDWESWRRFSASQFNAADRNWSVYQFTDPMTEIPAMLVGPFHGWQSRLPAANRHTFADLVSIPEQASWARVHEKIASMLDGFPADTELIGLRRTDTGQIICMEGHHRATAVALSAKDGKSITSSPVRIALADIGPDELGVLDAMLRRGSDRVPPTN